MRKDPPSRRLRNMLGLKRGDDLFAGILVADFFGAIAGSVVFLSMVWWVLDQDTSDMVFGLMMLSIVVPLNLGILLSGPAVARFGARQLLLWSKLFATLGAGLCMVLVAIDLLTLPVLAVLSVATYASLGPSVTADLSRAPAIARLASRRLIDFNAANGLAMLAGGVLGFWLAGIFSDQGKTATALGIAVLSVSISTFWTWLSFPRDRRAAVFDGSARAHLADLVRKVLVRVLSDHVLRNLAICAALLIAVSDVYEDIYVPLTIRAQGQDPSTLSFALTASLLTSAGVSLLVPFLERRVDVRLLFLVSAIAACLVITLNMVQAGFIIMMAVIIITTLSAGVTATIGFTRLQESMPQSLQAQAIGIWQGFVMAVGSVALLTGGLLGSAAIWLLAALAALSVGTSFLIGGTAKR